MSLTPDELKWVKKMQRALNTCPSTRLGFYTTGDNEVIIFDKGKEDEINEVSDGGQDFCIGVDNADAHLGELTFPSGVYSTAG